MRFRLKNLRISFRGILEQVYSSKKSVVKNTPSSLPSGLHAGKYDYQLFSH